MGQWGKGKKIKNIVYSPNIDWGLITDVVPVHINRLLKLTRIEKEIEIKDVQDEWIGKTSRDWGLFKEVL